MTNNSGRGNQQWNQPPVGGRTPLGGAHQFPPGQPQGAPPQHYGPPPHGLGMNVQGWNQAPGAYHPGGPNAFPGQPPRGAKRRKGWLVAGIGLFFIALPLVITAFFVIPFEGLDEAPSEGESIAPNLAVPIPVTMDEDRALFVSTEAPSLEMWNLADGEKLWEKTFDGAEPHLAIKALPGQDQVLVNVTAEGTKAYLLDAKSGEQEREITLQSGEIMTATDEETPILMGAPPSGGEGSQPRKVSLLDDFDPASVKWTADVPLMEGMDAMVDLDAVPVVEQDDLLLLAARPFETDLFYEALEKETGTFPGWLDGSRFFMAVGDDVLGAGPGDHTLVASLFTTDGEKKWTTGFDDVQAIPWTAGDELYFSVFTTESQWQLQRVNLKDGSFEWTAELGEAQEPGLLADVDDKIVAVPDTQGGYSVVSVDPESGEVGERTTLDLEYPSQVLVGEDKVLISGISSDGLRVLAMEPENSTPLWDQTYEADRLTQAGKYVLLNKLESGGTYGLLE